jgi:tRNA(Ile)-lysidine synthase
MDRLDGALRLRLRRPGDRFFPLGMEEPKKLQDFFVDERVPREQRDRIPLLVRGDAIVWVVGMRIDERFKLTPSTKRVLRLRFEPD